MSTPSFQIDSKQKEEEKRMTTIILVGEKKNMTDHSSPGSSDRCHQLSKTISICIRGHHFDSRKIVENIFTLQTNGSILPPPAFQPLKAFGECCCCWTATVRGGEEKSLCVPLAAEASGIGRNGFSHSNDDSHEHHGWALSRVRSEHGRSVGWISGQSPPPSFAAIENKNKKLDAHESGNKK